MGKIREKYIGDKAFYLMLMSVAVPIMVQNGITNFVSLLDNIMVGRIGTEPMSDEAIEKAAGLAQEAEEEAEEAGESVVDQWKQVFGQQQESADETVSKFEQAAGEIAEKAAVKND